MTAPRPSESAEPPPTIGALPPAPISLIPPIMTELAKSFEPAAIEAHWGPLWESSGALRANAGPGQAVVLASSCRRPTSPARCTWATRSTRRIMDVLTRYHRMRGYNTLWLPGTDHAGIATQIVVERQLQEQGLEPPRPRPRGLRRARSGSGRQQSRLDHHRARCAAWATRSTGRASTSRWTTSSRPSSPRPSCACYEEGLIYRGKRLVNWDPVLKSAVSDLEVESEEEDGSLWHIRYPLADGTRRSSWWPPPGPRPCSATSR